MPIWSVSKSRPAVAIPAVFAPVAGLVIPASWQASADEAEVTLPGAIQSPTPVVTPPQFPAGDFTDTPKPAGAAASDHVASNLPTLAGGAIADPQRPSAKDRGSAYDEVTSELVAQDEYSNTFRNVDGSPTTVVGQEPINVQQADGKWVPVSTSIRRDASGSRSVARHPLSPVFADRADAPELYSISDGEYTVSAQLLDATGSSLYAVPQRRGASNGVVIYQEALA